MSFTVGETTTVAGGVFDISFLGHDENARVTWAEFVTSADGASRDVRDVLFHADVVGATLSEDNSRETDDIKDLQLCRLQPAPTALTLRVQAHALKGCSVPTAPRLPRTDPLAQIMETCVQSRGFFKGCAVFVHEVCSLSSRGE